MAQKVYKDGKYTGTELLTEKEHSQRVLGNQRRAFTFNSNCLVCGRHHQYTSGTLQQFDYNDSELIIKNNFSALTEDGKSKLLRQLTPKEGWAPSFLLRDQTYNEKISLRQLLLNSYNRASVYHIGFLNPFKPLWDKSAHKKCICKNCVKEYVENPKKHGYDDEKWYKTFVLIICWPIGIYVLYKKYNANNTGIWYENNLKLILVLIFCWPIGIYGLYKKLTKEK